MKFIQGYREYQSVTLLFAFQIFLFVLIIIGVGLIFARDMWVPSVVSYLLHEELQKQSIEIENANIANEISVPTDVEADEGNNVQTIRDNHPFGWKTYSNSELGISFFYPTFGLKETIYVERSYEQGVAIKFYFEGQYQDRVIPPNSWAFDVIIQGNKEKLPPDAWVRKHVTDCDYHTYSTTTLPSGFESVYVGIDLNSTSEDGCDPVGFYDHTLVSPSRDYVVNVSHGHDGLLRDEVTEFLDDILTSVQEIE